MYTSGNQDKVVPCEGVPRQLAGAPMPVVIANDDRLMIIYELAPAGDECVALRFEGPVAHYFGPPNDEALRGHALAGRGLGPYREFEVVASSWVSALERMNRVHQRHDATPFSALRHFIFTFHDKTFECVARGVSVAARVPNDAGGMKVLRELLGGFETSLM